MKLENDKLFELREYNNLTQKAVGEILGVRQQTYAEWEKGKKIIPLKHLVTLAIFYKVSIDYLTGLSRNKKVFYTYKTLNKEEIGKRIVYVRNLYNIKQKDLAKILNTSPSTVCAYEKGNTLILTAFLYQIAREYNISIDWLIGANSKIKRD